MSCVEPLGGGRHSRDAQAATCDHATAIDQAAGRLLKTRSTADHHEAVAAFAKKRKPAFPGN